MSGLTDLDAAALDALVRLQLVAHRFGATIELHNASAALVDVLALAGLADVLPVAAASGLEPPRQAEQREEALVDEEVDPGDAPG